MADAKLTALSALAAASADDILYVVDDPGGTPVSKKITVAALFTGPRITTSILDANGNPMIAFGATASAVDGFTFTNAATGNPSMVTMAATGSDSNISLQLSAKGTGNINIGGNFAGGMVAGMRFASVGGTESIFISPSSTQGIISVYGSGGNPGYLFTATTNAENGFDLGLMRSAAGLGEVNDGVTVGAFRDWKVRTLIADSTVRLKGYTVATLPAGTQGDEAFVTDALAPTFLATIVGGGTVVTPVFFNGTNWVGN